MLCRLFLLASSLTILVACSGATPSELVYSEREFKKGIERSIPAAKLYIYTPTGAPGANADEALNFIRQTSGVSTIPEVLAAVMKSQVNEGYQSSAVSGRDDAFCAWRADGRFVIVVAARGERTVQLHHWARARTGNGLDASCDSAAEAASQLDATLASVS